jgi:hypothetical protein
MAPKFGIAPTCSGDCAHCSSNPAVDWTPTEIREIVQRMQKPGVEKYQHSSGGPRKCLTCGFKWVAKPGLIDECPQCGSVKSIVESTLSGDAVRFDVLSYDGKVTVLDLRSGRAHVGADVANLFDEIGTIYIDQGLRLPDTEPIARNWGEVKTRLQTRWREQLWPTPKIEVVFPSSNRTPEEELERTERLRRNALGLVPPADTVGDLSKVTAEKNSPRTVRQELRTMRTPGSTVGDLSIVTDERESFRAQADAMHAEKPEGATAGDLFYGRRSTNFKTAVIESQALDAERVKRAQKRANDAWLLRNPSALKARREEVVKKTKQFLLEAEQQRRGAA